MLKPIFTEKTNKLAREGKYTFKVSPGDTKSQIKSRVAKAFGVHVVDIKTVKIAGERGRNFRGRKINILPGKKAIVSLKGDEKIDIFDEKKKK